MTQAERILKDLKKNKNKYINSQRWLKYPAILRYAAVIHILRKDGYKILTRIGKNKMAEYKLLED